MAASASADGPLLDRILAAARRTPDAPAIVTDAATMRYRPFVALVSKAMQAFGEGGVCPGELTGVALASPVLTLIVLLALARLGAVSVCTSVRIPPEERETIFRRFGVRREASDGTTRPVAGVDTVVMKMLTAQGDEPWCAPADFTPTDETPMRLALTSGTTGTPKAVLQSHGGFVRRMDLMQCGDMRGARVLAPPLNVTAALNMALLALCEGASIVFTRDESAADLVAGMTRHRVTHVGLPPANLALVMRELREDRVAFPAVRHLRLMGGTPSIALAALARKRFSPEIYVPYGLGEIGVAAMATPDVIARDAASCGRVAPGATIEILDAQGRPCATGEVGEVRVRIDGMPRAYYGPDAEDRSRFRDGWFYPGDRARISEDGLLYVEGRGDDIVNIGGRKAAPAYLERMLESHPHVEQAAVFMVDAGAGGAPVLAAAIVPRAGLEWRALHAFALARLSTLAPTRYFEATALPRGELGKLARSGLREQFGRERPALDSPIFDVAP
jgi:acyl-coenzyme A synthetase/AMP-(fatty) acid ligase